MSADHTHSPIKYLRDFGIVYQWHDEKHREQGLDVPPFTTDIAASEQVVDAMFQRGYWCQERTPWNSEPTPGFDDGYWCGFTPHGTTGWNGTPDHWTCTATRPLARCLAALAAMEAHDAPGT